MEQIISCDGDVDRSAADHSADSLPPSGESWLTRATDPTIALSLIFALGGAQGVVTVVGQHWPIAAPGMLLGAALGGCLIAAGIFLLRRRLPAWSRQALLVVGAVITTVAVFACGAYPSSMSAASFYVILALYAAATLSPAATSAHVALTGVLYAVALALHPMPAFPEQWLHLMSVLAVMALIVNRFASRLRDTATALIEQAFHDSLTGLPNRALFLEDLAHALDREDPVAGAVTVLFMDLDDFKEVNDSFGYPVGDQLLISAARRLASVTRSSGSLARFGGDEFAVLIDPDSMPGAADDLAQRIVAAFEIPFDIGAERMHVGVSIGIAEQHVGSHGATELLRDADLAMYHAKSRGKGCYVHAHPGMQKEALAHLRLVADLRLAVKEEQFEVFYQPIVAVGSGQPLGVEALVRWHHPQRGLVAPDQFIAAAESSGVIVALGMWVLSEACRQAQAWRHGAGIVDDPFYVSVNLSPRQLTDPGLVDEVRRVLRESGLPSAALVLEITESTLMSDFDAGLATLQNLKGLGLRLALDDYGTGYSSLSRLRRLPIDITKIDKSFIDGLTGIGRGTELVRTIIDLSRVMGMVCVAEGVERTSQYDILERLGCDAIQGYLCATPASAIATAHTLQHLVATTSGDAFLATTRSGPEPFAKVELLAGAAVPRPTSGASR